jgi:hypothetical protein
VNPKDIKCPHQWWGKHEAMFPAVGFLASQILGDVIYNHKTLENLIFVSKNWPSDFRDGCKLPSNLIELI